MSVWVVVVRMCSRVTMWFAVVWDEDMRGACVRRVLFWLSMLIDVDVV